jgi:3-hydroxybutyrate dehydrogenase
MSHPRTALVTGASRGLGEAVARRLAADGYRVVLAARDVARLEAIAQTLEGARLLYLDVDDAAGMAASLAGFEEPIDVLVNAAGVSARAELGDAEAEAVWRRVMRTNLDGTFLVTRHALPHLADGARIVNFSSDLGKTGLAGYAAYCASKHGVIGLTRALALELAPRRITVNAVCPGWVETDMARQGFAELAECVGVTPDDIAEGERQAVPLGRFATEDEVAALVSYLVSPAASIMTGAAIDLSGGSVMA